MIRSEYYTLSNGVQIPKLGLGTWFIEDANAAQVVRDAVEQRLNQLPPIRDYGEYSVFPVFSGR